VVLYIKSNHGLELRGVGSDSTLINIYWVVVCFRNHYKTFIEQKY